MAAATKARSLPQPERPHSVAVYSTQYFLLCGLGGALACGPTHTLVCPLDVVKCNAQTDAEHFGKGTIRGLRYIYSGEAAPLGFSTGLRGVFKGGVPTFVGYSFQGAGKYGIYEYAAWRYSNLIGKEAADKYRPFVWAAASASAEFIADLFLCPFEAVKVSRTAHHTPPPHPPLSPPPTSPPPLTLRLLPLPSSAAGASADLSYVCARSD